MPVFDLATIETIGDQLLGRYVLAFEVASVLLLFALLGAIVLVTDRDEDDETADDESATAGATEDAV